MWCLSSCCLAKSHMMLLVKTQISEKCHIAMLIYAGWKKKHLEWCSSISSILTGFNSQWSINPMIRRGTRWNLGRPDQCLDLAAHHQAQTFPWVVPRDQAIHQPIFTAIIYMYIYIYVIHRNVGSFSELQADFHQIIINHCCKYSSWRFNQPPQRLPYEWLIPMNQ